MDRWQQYDGRDDLDALLNGAIDLLGEAFPG
jgi:hypothetical protein